MATKLETIFGRALIAIFLAAIFAPLLAMPLGLGVRGSKEEEKRDPAAFPARPHSLKELREYPRLFDAWLQDHFGFRVPMIRAHSRLLYFGLKTSPSPKVVLGKDGWLYYNGLMAGDGDPVADFRGTKPLSAYQLERWRWMFQDESDWFAEHGIRFLLALIPGKEGVYPEHVPDWMTRVYSQTTLEQLASHLAGKCSFAYTNLLPTVVAASKTERAYWVTDTHWNEFGAWHGYRGIIAQVAEWYPAVTVPTEDQFKIGYGDYYAGDLAQMMYLRADLREHMIYMTSKTPLQATQQLLGDRELPDLVTTVADTNLPRTVIFRDSFTEYMIPYLSEHFSTAFYRWGRTGIDTRAVNQVHPHLVMHLLSDRALRMHFRYPTPMQEAGARRRFEQSKLVLLERNSRAGFADITAGKHAAVRTEDGCLRVDASSNEPELAFPAPPQIGTCLVLLRLEIDAPQKTALEVQWDSPGIRTAEDRNAYRVTADLRKGRNEIYLPLIDPELRGTLRVLPGKRAGVYRIHSLEYRGVPRGTPPAAPALATAAGS